MRRAVSCLVLLAAPHHVASETEDVAEQAIDKSLGCANQQLDRTLAKKPIDRVLRPFAWCETEHTVRSSSLASPGLLVEGAPACADNWTAVFCDDHWAQCPRRDSRGQMVRQACPLTCAMTQQQGWRDYKYLETMYQPRKPLNGTCSLAYRQPVAYVNGIMGLGNSLFPIAAAVDYAEKYGHVLVLRRDSYRLLNGGPHLHAGQVAAPYVHSIFRKARWGFQPDPRAALIVQFGELRHDWNRSLPAPAAGQSVILENTPPWPLILDALPHMTKHLDLDDAETLRTTRERYGDVSRSLCVGLRIGWDFHNFHISKQITNRSIARAVDRLLHDDRERGELRQIIVFSDVLDGWRTLMLPSPYPNPFASEDRGESDGRPSTPARGPRAGGAVNGTASHGGHRLHHGDLPSQLPSQLPVIEARTHDIAQLHMGMRCRALVIGESTFHLWMALLATPSRRQTTAYFARSNVVDLYWANPTVLHSESVHGIERPKVNISAIFPWWIEVEP